MHPLRYAKPSLVLSSSFYEIYQRLPDLLVIIRGGGAVGDLAYLNDYELAALVAEQPVPVWVGIGHERDKVILDEVAHTSFDTPSKVIAAIHSHLAQLVTQTLQYQAQIKQAAQRQLNTAEQQSTRQLSQIQSQTIGQLTALRKDNDYAWRSIQQSAQRQVKQAARLTAERYTQTQTSARQQLTKAATNSKTHQESICKTCSSKSYNHSVIANIYVILCYYIARLACSNKAMPCSRMPKTTKRSRPAPNCLLSKPSISF